MHELMTRLASRMLSFHTAIVSQHCGGPRSARGKNLSMQTLAFQVPLAVCNKNSHIALADGERVFTQQFRTPTRCSVSAEIQSVFEFVNATRVLSTRVAISSLRGEQEHTRQVDSVRTRLLSQQHHVEDQVLRFQGSESQVHVAAKKCPPQPKIA